MALGFVPSDFPYAEAMVTTLKENYKATLINIPRKVPYACREDEHKEIKK